MFGLGFSEILLCLLIALIVFGPQKLPEIARMLGKTMGELRRTLDDLKYELSEPVQEIRKELRDPARPAAAEPAPVVSPSESAADNAKEPS